MSPIRAYGFPRSHFIVLTVTLLSAFQAIDLFYNDSAAQAAANGASSKAAASNDKKLGQIWDKYKGLSLSNYRCPVSLMS